VLVAILAAFMSAVGLVAFASGNGPGSIGAGASSLPDAGVVRLRLGSTDSTRFDTALPAGGYAPGTAFPITTSGCAANLGAGPLAISPTPAPPTGKLGLKHDSIGVGTHPEGILTSCGRVDGVSQALTIQLAGPAAGKLMDFAELDVERKYGGKVRAELYHGTELVLTEVLPGTGGNWIDFWFGDNKRWRLPSDGSTLLFDKLVLRVDPSTPHSSFGLEGGGDGTPALPGGLGESLGTKDSLFHVVAFDGALECGDETTEAGGEGQPDAALTRFENQLGTPEDCVGIPFVLRAGNEGEFQTMELLKDLGDQAALNPVFRMTIEWEPEAAAYPITRVTQIDYDDGNGPHDIQWCADPEPNPTLPEGELWCLTNQDVEVVGGGQIVVTEHFFGAGDPRWAR
jgi:hypothetical protein